MALIRCPRCDHRMSTLGDSCPECGWSDRTRPAGVTPSAWPRRRLSLAVDSAIPGTPDADEWIRRWANVCGGMLIAGFLCPLLIQGFGGTHVIWQWDIMKAAKVHQGLAAALPLLLGVATLVVGNRMDGVRRAAALFAMAGGTWVLYALLGGAGNLDMTSLPATSGGGPWIMVLIPLAACAVAIGNRIRKRQPAESLPRTLAGVGGIVLVACFLIPVGDRRSSAPLISLLFENMIWRSVGPLMVIFVGVLAYGAVGAFSLMKIRDVHSFCRLLSVLARALLIGAPLTLLFTYWIWMSGAGMGTAFTLTLKLFSLTYGHLILFAVGLTSWVEHSMANRPKRARIPTTRRPA